MLTNVMQIASNIEMQTYNINSLKHQAFKIKINLTAAEKHGPG